MSFFQDMVSVFRKKELSFIESYQESDDVYTFRFEKAKDLTWKAGQYGLFSITHAKIKKATRPFSLASAPAEHIVQITTRIRENPSDFKKAMLAFKPGMTIKMGGPVGAFCLEDRSPALLVAGGIGITPIRSIVKQLEAEGKKDEKHIHLLYMDSQKTYVFKDELDAVAARTSIRVSYLDSRDRLQQEIDQFAALHPKDDGQYLLSGPKAMVDSTSAYLLSQGVSKQQVKKDVFYGY